MSSRYTRKQLITSLSVIYLIFTTALAGYASSRANKLSIPISNVLSGFVTALPAIAGLLLEGGYDITRSRERRRRVPKGQTPRPPLVIVANTIIFIYSTVVITLLGTHAAPTSGLNCGLEQRWHKMFSKKNAEAIKLIQDEFNCCGLMNSHDQAWPFPDKSHQINACEQAFGRTKGCLGPWKSEEQNVAGILMAVVGLIFVWQFAIIVTPTAKESWLHRVLPDRVSNLIADEEQIPASNAQRAIRYHPYRDNVDEGVQEVDDSDEEETFQRVIEGPVQPVKNALPRTTQETDHAHPTVENEWARD